MDSLQDLALVILNYNSSKDTLVCVNKLLSFHSDFHIIVVDNRSTDDSYVVIKENLGREENVDILLSDHNGGYSYGNNYGMKYAVEKYGCTVLGVLNPDIIIPKPEVLSRLKAALESDPSFAVIGGAMIDADNTFDPHRSGYDLPPANTVAFYQFARFEERRWRKRAPIVGDNLTQVECITGCFYLAKTSIMQEIGYLDENVFMYREEELLGSELKRLGYKEVVAYDQFYIHNHKFIKHQRMTFRKKVGSTKELYKSHKYLIKKYYSPIQLPLLWCVELLNKAYLLAGYILNLFIGKEAAVENNVSPEVIVGGARRELSSGFLILFRPYIDSDKEAMVA